MTWLTSSSGYAASATSGLSMQPAICQPSWLYILFYDGTENKLLAAAGCEKLAATAWLLRTARTSESAAALAAALMSVATIYINHPSLQPSITACIAPNDEEEANRRKRFRGGGEIIRLFG